LLSLLLVSFPDLEHAERADAAPPAPGWVAAPASVATVRIDPATGNRQVVRVVRKQQSVRLRTPKALAAPATSGRVRWTVRVRTQHARRVVLVVRTGAGKRRRHAVRVPARRWTAVRVTTGTGR